MFHDLLGIANPSSEYRMDGYSMDDLGPQIFENRGEEIVKQDVARIVKHGKEMRDCPMLGRTTVVDRLSP
jgi:hypothetical protein